MHFVGGYCATLLSCFLLQGALTKGPVLRRVNGYISAVVPGLSGFGLAPALTLLAAEAALGAWGAVAPGRAPMVAQALLCALLGVGQQLANRRQLTLPCHCHGVLLPAHAAPRTASIANLAFAAANLIVAAAGPIPTLPEFMRVSLAWMFTLTAVCILSCVSLRPIWGMDGMIGFRTRGGGL